MIEKLAVLSYLATIYPIGTRFAARLIARQKRHELKRDRYSRPARGIEDTDRAVSILFGYVGAIPWPITLIGIGVVKVSSLSVKELAAKADAHIDKHVAKIEGQEQTLGKLGPR